MTPFQAVILALVQAATEFLPVSSSGHLILVPRLLGWSDQGLEFDIATNTGTLIAVLAYFRRDLAEIARGWLASFRPGGAGACEPAARLGWALVWGTIPAGLVGLAIKDWLATYGREPRLIATTAIVYGLLLGLADRFGRKRARARRDRPARGPADRLRAGAGAGAGHLALGGDDERGARPRPRARRRGALLVPALGADRAAGRRQAARRLRARRNRRSRRHGGADRDRGLRARRLRRDRRAARLGSAGRSPCSPSTGCSWAPSSSPTSPDRRCRRRPRRPWAGTARTPPPSPRAAPR